MADPRNYYVHETLKDGTPVTIRAIRKDDKKSILDAFRALDREAVYRRFFSPKEDLTGAELEQVIGYRCGFPPSRRLGGDSLSSRRRGDRHR